MAVINGTKNAENLPGTPDDDIITSGCAPEGSEGDVLIGEGGNDVLIDAPVQEPQDPDIIFKNAFEALEVCTNNPGAIMHGGVGNNAYVGGDGRNFILGGEGDEVGMGNGDNDEFLLPDALSTEIDAGDGNDTVTGSATGPNFVNGGSGEDNIEILPENTANNELWGGPDNDTIKGASGNDIIFMNSGNDLALPGDGNDVVSTGPGDDTIQVWFGPAPTDGNDSYNLTLDNNVLEVNTSNVGNDIVANFTHGEDRIDLRGVLPELGFTSVPTPSEFEAWLSDNVVPSGSNTGLTLSDPSKLLLFTNVTNLTIDDFIFDESSSQKLTSTEKRAAMIFNRTEATPEMAARFQKIIDERLDSFIDKKAQLAELKALPSSAQTWEVHRNASYLESAAMALKDVLCTAPESGVSCDSDSINSGLNINAKPQAGKAIQ